MASNTRSVPIDPKGSFGMSSHSQPGVQGPNLLPGVSQRERRSPYAYSSGSRTDYGRNGNSIECNESGRGC